jgi:hypothetical protein
MVPEGEGGTCDMACATVLGVLLQPSPLCCLPLVGGGGIHWVPPESLCLPVTSDLAITTRGDSPGCGRSLPSWSSL